MNPAGDGLGSGVAVGTGVGGTHTAPGQKLAGARVGLRVASGSSGARGVGRGALGDGAAEGAAVVAAGAWGVLVASTKLAGASCCAAVSGRTVRGNGRTVPIAAIAVMAKMAKMATKATAATSAITRTAG